MRTDAASALPLTHSDRPAGGNSSQRSSRQARIVMRSGGDAGTAVHTSVPFGIAATMATVSIHCGEDIGRQRVEPPTPTRKRLRGKQPGAKPEQVVGSKRANSVRASTAPPGDLRAAWLVSWRSPLRDEGITGARGRDRRLTHLAADSATGVALDLMPDRTSQPLASLWHCPRHRLLPATRHRQNGRTCSSLPSSIGKPDDAMRPVVEAQTLSNSIGQDGIEQPNTAAGDTTPTTNDRQTAWLGFLPGGRIARGDIVHEAIDIVARDRGHRPPTDQGDAPCASGNLAFQGGRNFPPDNTKRRIGGVEVYQPFFDIPAQTLEVSEKRVVQL